MKHHNEQDSQTHYTPLGMSIGISIGVAIGVATDHLAVLMPIGMSIGLCIGAVIDAANRKKAEDTSNSQTKDNPDNSEKDTE